MTTQELAAIIQRSSPKETWVNNLEARKKAELEFHNRYRDDQVLEDLDEKSRKQLVGNRKYYAATSDAKEYVRQWVAANCRDKVVLDLACGDGALSCEAAIGGAALCIGVDLSDVSIQKAARSAREQGISDRTIFIQGDAEDTGLPDQSIDVVLCSGMLHHLDLSYAFPEIRRVLKHGGVAFGWEALAYNPLIKMYRNLTPVMRTEWEKNHILTLADLKFSGRFFKVRNVRYWTLLSLIGVFCRPLLPTLQSIDHVLLRWPLIRNLSWSFTFELHRP
jgi:ubiquinone/menaquinone biosynthesis C-methylase UbiE